MATRQLAMNIWNWGFEMAILGLNRNARPPKKANHGSRPCSSVVRRLKRGKDYQKSKENLLNDPEEFTTSWDDL
ncbi:hypothetical protein pb186bvf_003241 [Paramecium bursaria]